MSKPSWKTIKVPLEVYNQIKEVIPFLGYPSVAEYVRAVVRENSPNGLTCAKRTFCALLRRKLAPFSLERLRRDMLYVDDIKEKIENAKEEMGTM